jgi:flagellar motor switch protein FliN/FliY
MKLDLEDDMNHEYEKLTDISISLTTDLGQTSLKTSEFLKLKKGSVIDLNKPAGESVEIYVNNKIIGKGEVMVYEENLAVRINEILDADSIIKNFKKEPK